MECYCVRHLDQGIMWLGVCPDDIQKKKNIEVSEFEPQSRYCFHISDKYASEGYEYKYSLAMF